ncbi:MAG: 5'-nucleotidase C-terminal domain-containing protein, partial [Muribaculaceae bacterium]|nr:5'-nucleotidase C-terminal domain-containing protein [Muribaculaceae bacterium]
FQPYVIKKYGDKRVGFFGINVNPAGLIVDKNYPGMLYLDASKVADATAKYLKEVQKVDYAIMVSHIGYSSTDPTEVNDTLIVHRSHFIDMVVSAHSHTVIKPNSEFSNVKNADGKIVIIGQNGKSGKYVGKYDLDLETGKIVYDLVDIDSKLDPETQKYTALKSWLAPFSHGVDSLMNNPIGHSARFMDNKSNAAQNWLCDAVMNIIPKLTKQKAEFAIMNKGGIRVDMPLGVVTEGVIGSMFPFDNRFMVLEITGADLLEGLRVMATRGGDAVSKELKVEFKGEAEHAKIVSAKLNGKVIKPNKTYKFVTIDYLANGGDYMESFKNAKRLFVDDVKYGIHMLDYIKELEAKGKVIDAKDEPRMVKKD